jgi:precorrin-6B methylase 2
MRRRSQLLSGFAEAWQVADTVHGWLTRDQARALWDAALSVPPKGIIVEIGSHQGRSTIVLAKAARDRDAEVVAIDPFVEGRLFGGAATRAKFEANVERAGVTDTVRLIADRSTVIRPSWREPIDMLYIDGKHDYWTVRDDLSWTEFLPEGASVLIHDAFSSIGVTLCLLVHVLPSRTISYLGRDGSLARFVAIAPSAADRWRIVLQLPWFIRNVGIKVALRLARLVGYHGIPDPY